MRQIITNNLAIWTTAPNGIKKLRELILELAVRGLLVPQDRNDEPASELLKKIAEEKARLVSEGKIKSPKPLAKISEQEKPFVLPMGWEFCRFGTLVNSIISGGTPSKINSQFWDGDIPWASVKDLGKSKYLEKTQDYITQKGLDAGSKLADINDVIICTRMGLGKIAIAKVNVAINQDLKAVKLTSLLNVEFFLNSFATLKIKGTGTTVAGIKQEELLSYLFALPPLAEQQRIVAKVDELMQLCDRLEEKQSGNQEMHRQLVSCLLTTLTEATDAQAFQAAWSRIAENFDCLFNTETSIDQLKQTILQLAVMGKLVPQNPNDEPASELLKKIATEKAQLITEGKIKKQNLSPKINEQEKPFTLPKSWEWIRLASVAPEFQNGASSRGDYKGEEITVIRLADIKDYRVSLSNTRKLVINEKSISNYKLDKDDNLIIRVNGSSDIVGRFITIEEPINAIYCDHFIRMRFPINSFTSSFIKLLGSSKLVRDNIQKLFITTAGQKTVNQGHINSLIIPLPPLAEQHSIVAKVDELMVLCEQLKTKLATAQTLQQQLAETLVQQAVA
ncbi:MAG: restriction endonuclease subunit S [Methylococcaceae bacterium]